MIRRHKHVPHAGCVALLLALGFGLLCHFAYLALN